MSLNEDYFFTEIKPWMRSNMAFNRFTWVNVSGLPLAMWNKDSISNILAAQGSTCLAWI